MRCKYRESGSSRGEGGEVADLRQASQLPSPSQLRPGPAAPAGTRVRFLPHT